MLKVYDVDLDNHLQTLGSGPGFGSDHFCFTK